jgi:hypothetical protein
MVASRPHPTNSFLIKWDSPAGQPFVWEKYQVHYEQPPLKQFCIPISELQSNSSPAPTEAWVVAPLDLDEGEMSGEWLAPQPNPISLAAPLEHSEAKSSEANLNRLTAASLPFHQHPLHDYPLQLSRPNFQDRRQRLERQPLQQLLKLLCDFWFSHTPQPQILCHDTAYEEDSLRATPGFSLIRSTEEPANVTLQHLKPILVGEIVQEHLPQALDQQKHRYTEMEIPEYWVIDLIGRRVFAFYLQESGEYREITYSRALTGLPISLFQRSLHRLVNHPPEAVLAWLSHKLHAHKQP